MTNATENNSGTALTAPKFTAAQIEKDCPDRLQQISKEIAERLERAHKQNEVANNHLIAANELLAEAKTLCDAGGFKKFRELFCPQLGKTQAYVLRAIGAGKKTLAGHRAEQRERKQKSRATQKAAASNSGTVTEKSKPEPEALSAATEDGAVQATSSATEQAPAPTEPQSAAKPNDIGMSGFNSHVMELKRRIGRHKPEHFSATAVPADDLAKLGKFFTDIANFKKSKAVKPASIMAPPDDSTLSVGQPAVAELAALEASVDEAA